jgi:hypothetical protein
MLQAVADRAPERDHLRWKLGAEPLAPFGAAARQDALALLRRHAQAKAVAALTLQAARTICAFRHRRS